MHNDVVEVVAFLILTPRCHFLMTSYALFVKGNIEQEKNFRKTILLDVMRSLP